MESTKKYWLIIEPYVYINLTEENVLLYNTLDSAFIESSQIEVIDLIRELLKEENVGVIRIETKQLAEQPVIKIFIDELREKFMGDLVDQSLQMDVQSRYYLLSIIQLGQIEDAISTF